MKLKKVKALNRDLSSVIEEIAEQDGAPLWVELIPQGEDVIGRDGRAWTNSNPQGILDAFEENSAELPIDIEHATELKAPNGDPAPAVGWIKGLELREEGAIWALVEWTQHGLWLVRDKEYKYLSPVFTYDSKTGSITQLFSAGLTNQPNLKLTALNRREENHGDDMSLPLALTTALNISSAATDEQALAAINSLKSDKEKALNSAETPSVEKFVPRADHDVAINRATEAEAKLKGFEEKAINQSIDTAVGDAAKAGKISPASVEFHKACCQQEGGLERFEKFIETAPEIAPDTNLGDENPDVGGTLSAEETAMCAMLGTDHKDFKQAKSEETV